MTNRMLIFCDINGYYYVQNTDEGRDVKQSTFSNNAFIDTNYSKLDSMIACVLTPEQKPELSRDKKRE